MQPDIVPNLPSQQRMLLRRIVANQQDRRRIEHVAHAGARPRFFRHRGGKRRKVGGAVVVDIIGLKGYASELLQQIIFFVCVAVRSEYSYSLSTMLLANFLEAPPDQLECVLPRGRSQLSVLANQRLRDSISVLGKVERVTPFNAEKITIDATLVAIVATHDFHAGV